MHATQHEISGDKRVVAGDYRYLGLIVTDIGKQTCSDIDMKLTARDHIRLGCWYRPAVLRKAMR